jgi:error-prone DNA polymerase
VLYDEEEVALPAMPPGEHVVQDYGSLRLSLKGHPMSFLRADMENRRVIANDRLMMAPAGRRVTVAGLDR